MIQIENFSFAYHKGRPIYEDLDLTFVPGKIYGLFGKNGEGKSTLLKNITGLNSPTKGRVRVNDKTSSDRKPSFLSDIFMIPEEVYIPSISPMNFVWSYGALYPKFSFDHFCDYLNRLDVPESKNLSKLSFGQQKKFYIAFALACNTAVVVMDEPTNGLDIPSKSQFRKLIAATMTDEKIVIISTHQVRDLDTILDHILIVNKGKITLNASANTITEKLAFNFYTSPPNQDAIILQDEVIGGYAVLEANRDQEDTKINLEQLFNASVLKSEELTAVFESKNKE